MRAGALLALIATASGFGLAPEPWLPLNNGSFVGEPQPFSPDPLVRFRWDLTAVDDTQMQLFPVAAVACGPAPGTPASSFVNASSAVGSTATSITVAGAGRLVIDFGVELAAYLEIDAVGVQAGDAALMTLSLSEYTVPEYQVVGFYTVKPKVYGENCSTALCTYRLEWLKGTEMYEGMRYGFVSLSAAPSAPFYIVGVRAVAQAKPVNYIAAFSAAGDPLLESIWWTAVYTVRVTLQSLYMGSILMSRGDRFSWTGDANPTQLTAMVALGSYKFTFVNLDRTKGDCQGIATYCVYFVLSVADYWRETGNVSAVEYFTPWVSSHLDGAAAIWTAPENLRFVGWDDRLGSGFANHTTTETQHLFRLLTIRACRAAAGFFNESGNATASAKYAALATALIAEMRLNVTGATPWWSALGMHAGADAVNAGFLAPDEAAGIAGGALSDIVKLPSQSNFNQFFLLQAQATLGQLDRGVESARVVWGSVIEQSGSTFWETSHPSAAELLPAGPSMPPGEQSGYVSYCHPWSSGVAPWLTAWVLGVRALAPGYARVLVAPHVAHSMTGVRGRAATPAGAVGVDAAPAGAGAATVAVELPAGVSARVQLSATLLARLGVRLPAARAAAALLADALGALTVETCRGGGGETGWAAVRARVEPAPADSPLLDEGDARSARAPALVLELAGAGRVEVRVRGASAAAAGGDAAPAPRGLGASPFPPPSWPGEFVRADEATAGNWTGVYGRDGYVLLGFDAPGDAPPQNPFCGRAAENAVLNITCTSPGATIASILFASYGTPDASSCPAFSAGACAAPSSLAVVTAACVGRASCALAADTAAFGGADPCVGWVKALAVVANCTSGGGTQPGASGGGPADRARLPAYVASAGMVGSAGFSGATFNWVSSSADVRALLDPANASHRALGLGQPHHNCPTAPFDVRLTDAALAAGARYRFSAYFVDFAPSPEGTFDGTARAQEVYLLEGYPDFSPKAPRQVLRDFGGGVWLTWEIAGSVRLRISSISGNYAALSAVAWDPVPSVAPEGALRASQ